MEERELSAGNDSSRDDTEKGLLQRLKLYRKRVAALEGHVKKLESKADDEKESATRLIERLLDSNNKQINTKQLESHIGVQLQKEVESNAALQTAFHTLQLSTGDSYWNQDRHVTIVNIIGHSFQCRAAVGRQKEAIVGLQVGDMDLGVLNPFVQKCCKRRNVVALFGGLARYDVLSVERFKMLKELSKLKSAAYDVTYASSTATFISNHVRLTLEWRIVFPMDIGLVHDPEHEQYDGYDEDDEDEPVSKIAMTASVSEEFRKKDTKKVVGRVPVVFEKLVKMKGVKKAVEIMVKSMT